jgi:phage-related protein
VSWHIEYYESRLSRSPVEEFIDSLDSKSKAKVAKTLDLLEEFGVELGMPYVEHIEKQLWELRVRYGRNRYRVIYFLYDGRTFVLLHGFAKKTATVPRADLEIAETRRNDYLSRRQTP